ncbi:3',5'-cyclic adenosine monophosphate phosphodiesterase CpdA [mine drainage metagenome]|uniref:3',5'-cyclic adenosine monophosphate phosphodiesterase CpdA n=1 Tax=mine drainage metagenome TaxID=410659 RepID=A0A1J5RER8_9ZZZZ
MRLCVMSDLHLEYERQGRGSLPLGPDLDGLQGIDVVILAGDVDEGLAGLDYAGGLARRWGCPVLYVPGNHEYYGHDFPSLQAVLRSAGKGGVVVLDRRSFVFQGWRFVGCTLWTDYELDGQADKSMRLAEQRLGDHRRIGWDGGGNFSPRHACEEFRASQAWLVAELTKHAPGRAIVITHHAPLPEAIAPHFRNGDLNAAFASDLRSLIRELRPALWIYGHTHHDIDVRIGETRVVARQRGYWGQDNVTDFRPLLIDLPE